MKHLNMKHRMIQFDEQQYYQNVQNFNKHYKQNVMNHRKRNSKMINQTADIYLQQSQVPLKSRYTANYAPLRSRNDYDTLKTITKKSIQINTTKNATLQPKQRTYYRRDDQLFRKYSQNKRYDEEQQIPQSRSPYLRREMQGRTTSLNRSTQKIKSSYSMTKNPQDLYKPRSSLSQHYDPQQLSHKRRVSLVSQDRNYILEQAKQYYRTNQFRKSIQLLKKYVKLSPQSSEAHYFLGMSYINNNQFAQGIQELLTTLQISPKYKKSLYLVIALAFKKLNKISESIQILTKGLDHFPDYYDCLVYRGKMYLKGHNYHNSIQDFAAAIQINPNKGFAYLGKGTAEKQLGMFQKCIETLTQGLKSDLQQPCREKRGMFYYQMHKYEKAIADFEMCTEQNGNPLHFIKGMIYYKLKKPMQAILCFQQCLKQDTNTQNVTSSVEMMMKIKIEDKDFYEAYHILNRTHNIDINKQVIEQWRLFLEGTLFMMKKKYKEGISTLSSLLGSELYSSSYLSISNKKSKERYEFLKPLIHLYKAFGELSEGNVSAAKHDYQQYENISKSVDKSQPNLSKVYNSLIMQAEDRFPKNCLNILQQASSLIPNKPEPYLFLAFERVQNGLKKDLSKKQQNLEYVIEQISKAIGFLPQLSNNHISTFYYYRGVAELCRGDFNKAIADVDKAIQKSQDNIPKYFYLRGLTFAIFGNFSQSIQDLSVAISLDDKYAKPYLERAKCLQIQGNSNEAFLDLQKYITLAPEDPLIHKYAGFLLFQNCAYEDCLAAFSHGSEDNQDHQMILTKAKCHFLLNNTKQCLQLFQKYHEESYLPDFKIDVQLIKICTSGIKPDASVQQYQKILSNIQKIIQNVKHQQNDCKIFKMRDMHQINASIYMYMGNYAEALQEFEKTLFHFRQEKKRELQKQFIEDTQEFQDEWSQVQIQFNVALCYFALKNYQKVLQILIQFQKSSERGKNWHIFYELVQNVSNGSQKLTQKFEIDVFQQNHRISKNWPKLKIPNSQIYVSLAFSYPFVEPPEMLPQFDETLLQQFKMSNVQKKPEAPWINRHQKGLVFTPNIQVFENLQLSITTKKPGDDQNISEINKPISDIDRSVQLSSSEFHLETQALKQKFKLDSLVEMKLKKIMHKKQQEK